MKTNNMLEEKLKMNFGLLLDITFKKYGLKQKELEKIINYTKGTISNFVRNRIKPQRKFLEALEEVITEDEDLFDLYIAASMIPTKKKRKFFKYIQNLMKQKIQEEDYEEEEKE